MIASWYHDCLEAITSTFVLNFQFYIESKASNVSSIYDCNVKLDVLQYGSYNSVSFLFNSQFQQWIQPPSKGSLSNKRKTMYKKIWV